MKIISSTVKSIKSEVKSISYSDFQVKVLSWSLTLCFLALTFISWWRSWARFSTLFFIVLTLVFASTVFFKNLWFKRYVYHYWMIVGLLIGFFVLRFLLVLIYFFAILPLGLTLKLLRFQSSKIRPQSFWQPQSLEDKGIRIS